MRAPEFWRGKTFGSHVLGVALAPLGWAYGSTIAYKAAHAAPYRAKARVICVGNLTVGGTGKTPIALVLARRLAAKGLRVCFLSRGYGGRLQGPLLVEPSMRAEDVGDEPLLLARQAPAIVAADRRAGAILADTHGFDVIIMDDGHQNFTLAKDLSLIVADAEAGFGNGRVVPAGPLREPVAQGLSRCDGVILNGKGAPDLCGFAGPVLRADLVPSLETDLRGLRFVAFAGIGRPEKFYTSLRAVGAELVATRNYADHRNFSAGDVARLRARAKAQDAALITTEKDYFRLAPELRDGISMLPVEPRFEDEAALDALLAPVMVR